MAHAQDGRQARWDKHNQQRRQHILDAAIEVIGAAAPGAEFHVQQIAAQAGLNRTVVYRHFADRADLENAIRQHIIDDLTAVLAPAVSLDGTVNEVISRIISTYVDWSVAHEALHAFAVQEADGAFQRGIEQIGAMLTELLELAIVLLGAELDDNEKALVDPLAHGLLGAVFGAVRRWLTRVPREPSAAPALRAAHDLGLEPPRRPRPALRARHRPRPAAHRPPPAGRPGPTPTTETVS